MITRYYAYSGAIYNKKGIYEPTYISGYASVTSWLPKPNEAWDKVVHKNTYSESDDVIITNFNRI